MCVQVALNGKVFSVAAKSRGKMLSVPPGRSPAALRKVLKDVFDESCDIKVENIGGQ